MRSIFDLDDLIFLRKNGLCLRHVGYEQGVEEQQCGALRGDAISLANYGLNRIYDPKTCFISEKNCLNLQKEIEIFIFNSLKNYHNPELHYTDAAFHLIDRGRDARSPYDFHLYPLGKCGSEGFSSKQIAVTIFTDNYQNENIVHATIQVLLELKDKLIKLKIQKVNEYLSFIGQKETGYSKELVTLLSQVIQTYKENTYLFSYVLPDVEKLLFEQLTPSEYATTIKLIEFILSSVDNAKKGEKALMYTYPAENTENTFHNNLSQLPQPILPAKKVEVYSDDKTRNIQKENSQPYWLGKKHNPTNLLIASNTSVQNNKVQKDSSQATNSYRFLPSNSSRHRKRNPTNKLVADNNSNSARNNFVCCPIL